MLLSPLAILPSGLNPFTFPKLALAALAVAIAFASPRRGHLPASVQWVCGLGAIALVVSALNTTGLAVVIVGRLPRYEGLLTLAVYWGCAAAGARLFGRPASPTIRTVHLWAAICAIVLGVFSVLDEAKISPVGWSSAERTGSLLGNATDQGLLAMMLVAVLVRAAFRRRSPLLTLGLLAALTTVALSGSRAAILSVVLVLAIHLVSIDRRRIPAILLSIVALGAAVMALPQSRDRLLVSVTLESRLLAWQETASMLRDSWLFGAGPSGYSDAIGAFQDPEWVQTAGAAAKPDSPHSWPLQALSSGGIALGLCAAALAILLLLHGWRAIYRRPAPSADADEAAWQEFRERRDIAVGFFAAMVGYGSALLINFTTPSTTCLAAFLAGAAITVYTPVAEPVVRRRVAVVAASAVTIAMGASALAEVALRSGAELAATGRVSVAQDRFAMAHRLRPLDPDVHMVAAEYLAQRASTGDLVAARATERQARRSLEVTPDSYESAVALGVALLVRNQVPEALGTLNAAVADYPYRGQAYTQRALALIRLGQIRAAIGDLQRAIVLRPSDPVPVRILLQLRAGLDAASSDEADAQQRGDLK